MRPGRADVLVVGGGVIGLSIAEALASDGLQVRLLEAEAPGAGASGAAAGMLAPIGEARGPGPMLRLGLESLTRFPALCARLKEETGIDPELEASGLLQLVASESERAAREALHRRVLEGSEPDQRPLLAAVEWVSGDALRAELPDLAPGAVGAFLSPHEAHLRPPRLVRALAAAAAIRGVAIEAGVRVLGLRRVGDRVVGVEASDGPREADQVVLATGPWTPGLIAAAGLALPKGARLPIEPVRGQILSLEPPLPALREILWAEGIYLVPKRDGQWVVGATEESVGFDRRVTAEGVAWLLDRARRVFPALDRATFGRAWAGLRPVSADLRPWIGPWPGTPGLTVAAGHGRNGVLLAPVTAERVRDGVTGKTGEGGRDPFAPERLASDPQHPPPGPTLDR